jgi:hypothetical protein
MSNPKPLTPSEAAQLIATLSRRKQEVRVYRYDDLSERDLLKVAGGNAGSAWLIVGESKKWL